MAKHSSVFGVLDSLIVGPADGYNGAAASTEPPTAMDVFDTNVEMTPAPDDAAVAPAAAVAPLPASGPESGQLAGRPPLARPASGPASSVSVQANVAKAGHVRDPSKYTRYDLSDVKTSAGQQAAALADLMAMLNRKAAAATVRARGPHAVLSP